jgi:transposase
VPKSDPRAYLPDDPEVQDHILTTFEWTLGIVSDGIVSGPSGTSLQVRVYDATPPERPCKCPGINSDRVKCATIGTFIRGRFTKHHYKDIKRHQKLIELRVYRRQFRCTNAGCNVKTFTEDLKEIDDESKVTVFLMGHIKEELAKNQPLSKIGRDCNLTEGAIRRINKRIVKGKDDGRIKTKLPLPSHAGIHLMRISGTDCCLFTDVDKVRVLEVVLSQDPAELAAKLREWFVEEDFSEVKLVSIPIHGGYRKLVRRIFPHAKIVVPRNYLQKTAHQPLGKIWAEVALEQKLGKNTKRTSLELLSASGKELSIANQKLLLKLLKRSNLLKTAYEQKEAFLPILTCETEQSARAAYEEWAAQIPQSAQTDFGPLLQGVAGWKKEVFGGFDIDYKDYLSLVERLVRALEAHEVGRGSSAEIIRGRILYGQGVRIIANLPPLSDMEKNMMALIVNPRRFFHTEHYEDLGSSIQKLIEYFEPESSAT